MNLKMFVHKHKRFRWHINCLSEIVFRFVYAGLSIERVEEFKHLGATLTDQTSIQEEIKSR
jgi:hypothetical protein